MFEGKKQLYRSQTGFHGKLKKAAHRNLKDKKSADHLKSIYLLGIGRTQKDVCEVLMLD